MRFITRLSSIAVFASIGFGVHDWNLTAAADAFPIKGVKEDETPVELGRVKWSRDLEAAQRTATKTNKPIMILFQEVPGCSTCVNFGKGPLSNRLLVEAIESDFLPVVIFNNKKEDQPWLKHFSEPSWNNPVVRFVDGELKDLIPRKDRIWDLGGVANRMVLALEKSKRRVPEYLKLIQNEFSGTAEYASFAMHCYWVGEVQFGSIRGVRYTKSAWYDGKEIVNVSFDPQLVSYKELVQKALQVKCASTIYTRSESQNKVAKSIVADRVERMDPKEFGRAAKPADQKYYFQRSLYRHLPLSYTQQVRINSAVGTRSDAGHFLSPNQKRMLELLKELQSSQEVEFAKLTEAVGRLDFSQKYDILKSKATSVSKSASR